MGRCCRRMMCKAMCRASTSAIVPMIQVTIDGTLGKETIRAMQTLLRNAGIPGVGPADGCM